MQRDEGKVAGGGSKRARRLEGAEEEVPSSVDGGVDQRGGEDGVRAAPGPAVEEAGDGSEDDVTQVGEAKVGDVGEAEEDRRGPPARQIALAGACEHVLQQAAEEKFFGPGGKEEMAKKEKRGQSPGVHRGA